MWAIDWMIDENLKSVEKRDETGGTEELERHKHNYQLIRDELGRLETSK